ncbi:hypothetical protein GOP47_0027847 [Adiantum capillus-veneris]|nr:hypothetical protein GOP47_0027847 [Adiantum capillus-veneris]
MEAVVGKNPIAAMVPHQALLPSQLHSLSSTSMPHCTASTPASRLSLHRLPHTHSSPIARLDCKPPSPATKAPPPQSQLASPSSALASSPLHQNAHTYSPSSSKAANRTSADPLRTLLAAALDRIEDMIAATLEHQHPLPSTADPQIQLAGNFFPVPENPVEHELEVEGSIPASLEGMYIRNGANPLFEPVAGHHLFDGDGMLHAVRFKQGIASYANRFTRTHRLQEEMRVGRAFFPKAIGELHGHSGVARLLLFYARSLCGLVDGSKGMGVANAGVVFFNGHLLAMSEDDLPYAVSITSAGDLTTLGRYDFNGQLNSPMIAHPKVDAKTGELFALSYDVIKKPYLKYFKFAEDGSKGPEVTISVKEPTMMHDFAITENYVVIPDQQVVFRLQEMLTGGSPVVHNEAKVPRFGILPRDDADESRIVWVDVPDCFCFHLWNAWEEGDEVVVIASCMTPADSIFNESSSSLQSILSEIRLNKVTKTSTRRPLVSGINLEAGQVNGNFLGRKSRYAYLAIADPWPKVSGIAKVDLSGNSEEGNMVTKFMYPPNCYGGEPMFVPRSTDASTAEDDGYVLTFMHNEETGKSELLILDSSSPCLEVLARVKLPARVPYGFHGTFIPAGELEHQKSGLYH